MLKLKVIELNNINNNNNQIKLNQFIKKIKDYLMN